MKLATTSNICDLLVVSKPLSFSSSTAKLVEFAAAALNELYKTESWSTFKVEHGTLAANIELRASQLAESKAAAAAAAVAAAENAASDAQQTNHVNSMNDEFPPNNHLFENPDRYILRNLLSVIKRDLASFNARQEN